MDKFDLNLLKDKVVTVNFSKTDPPDVIKSMMLEECVRRGYPVSITQKIGVIGGLFNKRRIPVLILSHPNPPRRYSSLVFVIYDKSIAIYGFGRSDAAFELDVYDRWVQHVKAYTFEEKKLYAKFTFGYVPGNLKIDEESNWVQQCLAVFKDLFNVK